MSSSFPEALQLPAISPSMVRCLISFVVGMLHLGIYLVFYLFFCIDRTVSHSRGLKAPMGRRNEPLSRISASGEHSPTTNSGKKRFNSSKFLLTTTWYRIPIYARSILSEALPNSLIYKFFFFLLYIERFSNTFLCSKRGKIFQKKKRTICLIISIPPSIKCGALLPFH